MKNLFFIIAAFALGMVSAIGPSTKANNITPTTIVVEKAGTLSTLLSQESMDTITSLILKGEINGDDVQVLRYMAGRDKDGEVSNGMLSELDMSEVQIKSEGTYCTGLNTIQLQTEGEIPQRMFIGCQSLKKNHFTESVHRHSRLCFSGLPIPRRSENSRKLHINWRQRVFRMQIIVKY